MKKLEICIGQKLNDFDVLNPYFVNNKAVIECEDYEYDRELDQVRLKDVDGKVIGQIKECIYWKEIQKK